MSNHNFDKAYDLSTNNRKAVEAATRCGCFYCHRIFPTEAIKSYTNDDSALCPGCRNDYIIPESSVIPETSVITERFLRGMSAFWFGL